jgi:succinate dehydrogenase / fumarate reductase, cytochrome b subunit
MTVTTRRPTTPSASSLPLYRTTVGKKAVMAVTGAVLYAFLIAHLIGNLKFFTGPVHFDIYAEWLRRIGEPLLLRGLYLWIQRGVLLIAVLAHIWSAYSLTRISHAARPVHYEIRRDVQASYAARTMRWSGVIIALFVAYHLLQFTTGTADPHFVRGHVYGNVVNGFKVWYVTAAYVVAMAALALHLYHGVWSMLQTLGLNRPSIDRGVRRFSAASAVVIFLGFTSVPVAVIAGMRP